MYVRERLWTSSCVRCSGNVLVCVPVVWLQVCEGVRRECLFLTVSAKPSIGNEHALVSVPVRVRVCGCGLGGKRGHT